VADAAADALVMDADPITQAELFALYARGELPPASAEARALAAPAAGAADWRVARASWLPAAGRARATDGADATLFIGAAAALGTASLYYGPQDKAVAAALPSPGAPAARMVQVTLVQDAFDAPYGEVKTRDGSGHAKPTHLKATVAAVQDGALALVLNDLTMSIEGSARGGPFASLAANVLFPAGGSVDGVLVNGARLPNISAGAPDVPLPLGATVAVRARGGVVAFRVPFADGLQGFAPQAALRFDGPAGSGAARLATYLYRGPNVSFPDNPPPSRSILLIAVGAAASDAEAADFAAALAAMRVTNDAANASDWRVTVAPPPARAAAAAAAAAALPPGFASTLEAALCVPYYKKIIARKVNGSDVDIPPGGELSIAYANGTVRTVIL